MLPPPRCLHTTLLATLCPTTSAYTAGLGASFLTGNWYEDRLATSRAQAGKQNGGTTKTIRQDKLVRGSEPDTFRTQTVDLPKTPSEPYTPADTMRTAKTTNIAMEARWSEVCMLSG
jgi:hypothetical protein